jgi:hypothetical protein
MFKGMDSISNSNDELSGNRPQLEVETFEMASRMQDMEFRLPRLPTPNTDDVPMPLLADTADLAQVIKVVNELIKRDLTVKRVE